MLGIYRPAAIGAFVSVKNEAALASLDVSSLTLGTFAYVTSEGLYFRLVTDGSNDLMWQQVQMGAPSTFTDPVTFDGTVTFNEEVTFAGGVAGGGQLVEVFSATVDLTIAGSTQLVPAVAGKQFVPSFLIIFGATNVSTAGTISTQPTISVGDSATFDNFITATQGANFPSSSTFNAGPHAMTRVLGGTLIVGNPGNPVNVKVATAATGTGGFAWTVKFTISGFYI